MKPHKFFHLPFTIYHLPLLAFFLASCSTAPAPVAVGNKSIHNGIVISETSSVVKPVGEMNWTVFDRRTNIDGSKSKLKDLQGKVVILDFWATYCLPCIKAIPHLKSLQAKHGKENLEIIGLHVGGEGDRPLVPEFADRLQIDYPLGTPDTDLMNYIFGNRSDIPQTAIFDRNGNLVKTLVGFSDSIQKEMDAVVEKAVNQK